MKQKFVSHKFKGDSLRRIAQANEIIEEYAARGQKLTLRQLYYRFVAKDLIPNTLRSYKNLGSLIDDARKAGKIDWAMIEDRTRNVDHSSAWRDAEHMMASAAGWYQENPWIMQDTHVEVWIEKEALIGVVEGVCEEFRVARFACRGYVSQSEAYGSGQRILKLLAHPRTVDGVKYTPKRAVILHLGDHDPSGIDMTRDVGARMELFSGGLTSRHIEIRRLALNRDQIDQYDCPPNYAKETDSRHASYVEEHGESSWELDALEPQVIEDLIRDELESLRDMEAWDTAMAREERERSKIERVEANWNRVHELLDADEENDDD